jgi:electron transfer flavoprotein beta subunit
MHSVVWAREIWDTRDLVGEILDDSGHPRWSDWEGRFDPEDMNALEMALQIQGRHGGEVTAVSVGQPRKLDVLRECLYRGVDRVLRLDSGDLASEGGGDAISWMAAALKQMEGVDALFTGIQLTEGESAQRGAMLAGLLGWPLVSYVEAVEDITEGRLRLRRAIEGGIQLVEVRCPAVVSVGVALVKDDPRAPRSAKAKLKLKHKKTQIPQWSAEDLFFSSRDKAAMRIRGYRPLEQRGFPSRRVDGSSEEELRNMLGELREKGLTR